MNTKTFQMVKDFRDLFNAIMEYENVELNKKSYDNVLKDLKNQKEEQLAEVEKLNEKRSKLETNFNRDHGSLMQALDDKKKLLDDQLAFITAERTKLNSDLTKFQRAKEDFDLDRNRHAKSVQDVQALKEELDNKLNAHQEFISKIGKK